LHASTHKPDLSPTFSGSEIGAKEKKEKEIIASRKLLSALYVNK